MPLRPGIGGIKRTPTKLIQGVNGVKTEVTEYWSSEGGVKKLVYQSNAINPILNDNSWDVIRQASDEGVASSIWAVGDRRAVVLNGVCSKLTFSNQTYYAYILGFDHNSEYEGANKIHFQLGFTEISGGYNIAFISGYSDYSDFYMNTSNTNVGGWNSCFIRNTVCASFVNCIPAELKSVIKTTSKYTDNTGGGTNSRENVSKTSDDIFILSEFEIFGTRKYANSSEQTKQKQYDYYKVGNSKIKNRHTSPSNPVTCWSRSPNSEYSTGFCTLSSRGNQGTGSATSSFGFAPAFCV